MGIAVELGDVLWGLGPLYVLYLAGLLSANLALVNILPFPPLDGGRMLVLLLKAMPALRHADLAPRGAADLRGRVRGAVHVPDLDHRVRHRETGGSGTP